MSRAFITTFVVGCLLGTNAVAADAPLKLHLSPAPDRVVDEVVVHSAGGPATGAAAPATGAAATEMNSATIRLFVWQTGIDKPVTVRLLGSLTPARGAAPTVKFLGESGTAVEQITVDAKGGHAIVTLQVEGLTRDGVYPGMLYWQYDGVVRPLIPLKVHRTSTPVLTVLGASGDKPTLAFQSETAVIAMPITIDSSGLSAVQDLRLSATPFVTKEGLQVNGKWSVSDQPMVGVGHEVAARGSLAIKLEATLPVPGDYTSQLTLNYADQHQVVSVVVKRERKLAAIDIQGLDKADGVVGWFRVAPSIWFSVAENSGRPVTLNMPQLLELTQKVGAPNAPQVSLQGATVWTADGKRLKEPIELRSGETRWLRMELPGLTSAGEMTGKLRVGVVDHQPVDHSFAMVLKESAWIASLFIALGVALSFLTRIYQQQLKPRLEQQRVAASLREELDSLAHRLGTLEADEQSILDGYRNALSSIEDKLRVKADDTLTAQLNAINRKLSLFLGWIHARRTVGALRGVRLPEEIETKLNDIRAFLVSTRTLDEAAATTATAHEEWLNGLRDRIHDIWKKQLVDSIRRFREEIQEAQVVLPETVRNEILNFLAEADKALNNGQLAAAAQAWEKSRSAFLIEQSRRFLTEVNEATPRPKEVSQGEWSVVTKYVVDELRETIRLADRDAELAGNRYHHAITRYLVTILTGLNTRAQELVARLDQEPLKSNSRNQDWKVRLKRDTLDRISLEGTEPTEMRKLLEGFQFDAVKRRYVEAQAALIQLEIDVEPPLHRGAVETIVEQPPPRSDGTRAADVVAVPGSFAWSADTGTPQRAIRLLSTAEIDAHLTFLQTAFSVVILLIAVVLGLQLLWVTKATWGGGGDYITAFLWGLGLHKVSDTALDIGALLNKGK